MESTRTPTEQSRLSPSSDHFTAYDAAHFSTYMQLLTFASDHASIDEMAQAVFGIDPATDPAHARQMVEAHLKRANWLLASGYKELFREAV
ncbi:hypothetical protein B0E33_18865 [Roseibium algicola]|uniref:T6SS Transcription factor RovC-like DNA binding domain-containing protein n=1 Tax=Roseibium algicola TaxID=2857014 RepID=A0ABN4WUK9_9HYPH|nr:DUF2285 domain-containing protein [Roseibium aggregatum]AQQ05385.1 hypothetical protein B0E33_18865 [Roseibium aggregatum]